MIRRESGQGEEDVHWPRQSVPLYAVPSNEDAK